MYNLMSMIKVQVDIDKCFLLRSSPIITRKSFNCESVQCCHRKTSMSMKVFNLRVKFFASRVHACALRLSKIKQSVRSRKRNIRIIKVFWLLEWHTQYGSGGFWNKSLFGVVLGQATSKRRIVSKSINVQIDKPSSSMHLSGCPESKRS